MRIRGKFTSLAMGLLVSVAATGGAGAQTDVAKDYLVGTWSLEGIGDCNVAGSEHIEFGADDTVRIHRGSQVDAVGFWEATGNRVTLHLVASPHRITGALHHLSGRYGYADLAAFVFDAEKDSFNAMVPFADELRRRRAHRCP